MNTYTIYFEIFGKKMKTTVQAEADYKAKEYVRNRIVFHKVEKVTNDDTIIDDLLNIFGMKK